MGIVMIVCGELAAAEIIFLMSAIVLGFCFNLAKDFSLKEAVNISLFWAALTSGVVTSVGAFTTEWKWILLSAILFWQAKGLAEQHELYNMIHDEENNNEDH